MKIEILRNGSLSEKCLRDFLKGNESYKHIDIIQHRKESSVNIDEKTDSPGQLLKHYSPYCETFLVDFPKKGKFQIENERGENINVPINLKNCALIDFGDFGIDIKNEVNYYCNLSEKNDLKEAMQNLYEFLRNAENYPDVSVILLSNISLVKTYDIELEEFFSTVYDKLFRSSAGKKITYDNISQKFYIYN